MTNDAPTGKSARIPFTQYLRPYGDPHTIHIDLDEPRSVADIATHPEAAPFAEVAILREVAAMAETLIRNGYRFEAEVLRTGEVSFEVCDGADDDDSILASVVVDNGPKIPGEVVLLVRRAWDIWQTMGRPDARSTSEPPCSDEVADAVAAAQEAIAEARDDVAEARRESNLDIVDPIHLEPLGKPDPSDWDEVV